MNVRMEETLVAILGLVLLAALTISPVLRISAATTVTVSIDKPSYYAGQTLTVSGTVTPVTTGQDLAITVTGPASDLRFLAQVTPRANGTYSTSSMKFDPNDPTGTWTVKATYLGVQAVTTLTYLGEPPKPSSIAISVSTSSPSTGASILVSGSISPPARDIAVTISFSTNGSWVNLTTVKTSPNGSYSYLWKPTAVGSYQLRASWEGNKTYTGAISNTALVKVNKIPTTISCKTSSAEITEGDTITISGAITPPGSGKTVNLNYTKPDGKTVVMRNVTTTSDGSYSDSYKPDATGSWSIRTSWNGDSEHQGNASQPVSFNVKKKGCIIATATYGSELSPEVQFLREFRDNTVLTTYAGSNFMTAFNAFYYSFSPSVASAISANSVFRDLMKVILYPLIGILHLSSMAFSFLSYIPELGVVLAGLVASSLIAVVYVVPLIAALSFIRNLKPSTKAILLTTKVWGGSLVVTILAEATMFSPLMMVSTGAFVVTTIFLTTLAVTRATMHRQNRS